MTRQQALDRFHELLKLRHHSDRTHKNYHLWVSRFLDFIQVEDIKTFTMEDARDYFIHLHSTGEYKDRTFNAAVDAIRYFYSVILGIQLTGKQLGKRKVPIIQNNTISPQQAAQLLQNCTDPLLKAGIALAYGYGLRNVEIANLKFDDTHKGSQQLTISNSKGMRTRIVHYSPSTAKILNEYIQSAGIRNFHPDPPLRISWKFSEREACPSQGTHRESGHRL